MVRLIICWLILTASGILWSSSVFAQQGSQVRWISFEQLEDSLRHKPKKVFIDLYTDWCTYCRKMDKEVFVKPAVAELLNDQYYAVRMDAETQDTIRFDGQHFVNSSATKRRKGIHDLALLLGQRNGQFAPPAMLVLDENFMVRHRYFEYLTGDRLIEILR